MRNRSEFLERKDIVELLRIEVEKAGSQLAWGAATGIDPSIVSKVVTGKLLPTPQIIRALKLRTVVVSERAVSKVGGHPLFVVRRGRQTKQPRSSRRMEKYNITGSERQKRSLSERRK